MTDREQYTPGPAIGADVRKDGEKWTLILVGELRHSPEKVSVKLTTVGAPATHARPDRLEDHLDRRAPAHMFKRFADVRSLYG
jgi:hypothetical protein